MFRRKRKRRGVFILLLKKAYNHVEFANFKIRGSREPNRANTGTRILGNPFQKHRGVEKKPTAIQRSPGKIRWGLYSLEQNGWKLLPWLQVWHPGGTLALNKPHSPAIFTVAWPRSQILLLLIPFVDSVRCSEGLLGRINGHGGFFLNRRLSDL